MSEKRKPSALTPVIALVLILLVGFGGYMGSYYAMLDEKHWMRNYVLCYPMYRIDNSPVLQTFYMPAHELDRRLRPDSWPEPPDMDIDVY